MLFNGFKLIGRSSRDDADRAFITKVKIRRKRQPLDAFLIVGWIFILAKCLASSWAVSHYQIPIDPLFVWIPSFLFGGVCTGLYLYRD